MKKIKRKVVRHVLRYLRWYCDNTLCKDCPMRLTFCKDYPCLWENESIESIARELGK